MTFYSNELIRVRRLFYSNAVHISSVVKTRNFINNHFAQKLDLDTLSGIACSSKYHLIRLFRQYYGQTPLQYITEKRIEKSKELLRNGVSVAHTCYLVGFSSPCSFSTLFRNRMGVAPSEFQKKQFSQSR